MVLSNGADPSVRDYHGRWFQPEIRVRRGRHRTTNQDTGRGAVWDAVQECFPVRDGLHYPRLMTANWTPAGVGDSVIVLNRSGASANAMAARDWNQCWKTT